VAAPASILVTPGVTSTIPVTTSDPDNDPVLAFTATLGSLPPGTVASFSPGSGNTSRTLTVTLPAGASGKYGVTLRAKNSLLGSAGIVLQTSGPLGEPRAYWKFNGNTSGNDSGKPVASGVYYAVLEMRGFRQSRRLALVK
jgi:hypothetical protein